MYEYTAAANQGWNLTSSRKDPNIYMAWLAWQRSSYSHMKQPAGQQEEQQQQQPSNKLMSQIEMIK